jgi:hypothetical protein
LAINGVVLNQEITSIEIETNISIPVYNFELDTIHNYFANDFIVHNAGIQPLPNVDHLRITVYYTEASSGGVEQVDLVQCNDGLDNDDDTLIDILDPQCHMDGNINNEYVPLHNSETIAPVTVGGGSSGGGGGGDLGFLNKSIRSLFNWSPYKPIKNLMLGMVLKLHL